MASYLSRIADRELIDQLGAMGAVLIEGVKGCGKTATARQLAASEVLLDTDPDAERRAALDPRLLLDGATPRLLDEWQRAPRVWDAVRREVDRRGVPGQFVLTGSATPADDVRRHTGAGRFGVLRMRTMTLTEKQASSPGVSLAALLRAESVTPTNSALGVRDYLHHIAVGGWPYLVGTDERRARTFIDGYLDVIVEHDIDEVSGGPRNPRLVRRFLHAYAQMTAHPATQAAILKRMEEGEGPSRPAAQLYRDALTRMLIIDEVPAWDPAVRSSKRLVSTPKRLLADPSLSAGLLRLSTDGMLADLSTTGFLFESLVAHDLRVYAEAAGASVFHYREGEGRLEVDFIVEDRGGEWLAVEVKLGDDQADRAAGSLRALAARVKRPPAAMLVVTTGSLAYTRDDGVHVVPLGVLGA